MNEIESHDQNQWSYNLLYKEVRSQSIRPETIVLLGEHFQKFFRQHIDTLPETIDTNSMFQQAMLALQNELISGKYTNTKKEYLLNNIRNRFDSIVTKLIRTYLKKDKQKESRDPTIDNNQEAEHIGGEDEESIMAQILERAKDNKATATTLAYQKFSEQKISLEALNDLLWAIGLMDDKKII